MTAPASMKIPTELLEHVERGNVLLFVGARLSRDPTGEVVLDRLAADLAERVSQPDAHSLSFPEIAQAYEEERGRQALVDFVRTRIEALGDEPQLVHKLIARLTQCTVLVTTTLSGRLERAFREAGRKLQVVIRNEDVAFEVEGHILNWSLFGARFAARGRAQPLRVQLSNSDISQIADAPTPLGKRLSNSDCLSSVMSAVGPATLSGTSQMAPVCSSTAIWVLRVCCFFLPL